MAKQNSGATYVVRRPGAKTVFRRTTGETVMEFAPEQPVEVSQENLASLKDDLGVALAIVEPDEKRPGNYHVDWPKTLKVRGELGSKGEPTEPTRKKVKAKDAVSNGKEQKPLSEAEEIRTYLSENPNSSNKEVIDGLAAKGIEVSGSQVSRERKGD